MQKAFWATGLLLGLVFSFLPGQTVDYSSCVSTHIEMPKDTLLLGEPSFLYFVLSNHSDAPVFVEEGGDYRSGRKISFEVFIITPEHDTLPWPELWGDMGGFVGYQKILPGESRKFKLFLPKWGKMETPGPYRLSVSKPFKIAPFNPFQREDYSQIQVVPKTSTTTFTVIDSPERLGANRRMNHCITSK